MHLIPGKTVIYFTGDLAKTRAELELGNITGKERETVVRQLKVSNCLRFLAEADIGFLTQKRLGVNKYEYRFTRRHDEVKIPSTIMLVRQIEKELANAST